MSYSYIKSVFPNFQKSDRVYNEDLYNNLNVSQEEQIQTLEKFTDIVIEPKQEPIEHQQLQPKILKDQSNLTYYNLPLNYTKSIPLSPEESKTQTLEKGKVIGQFENNCSTLECDSYIKHILECDKCKNMMVKNLGLENDKILNEEIMEVVSYIIFGIFILLLIDSIKTNK